MLERNNYLSQEFGTISDLINLNASTNANKLALIDGERIVSYAQLNKLINKFANKLITCSINPQSVIAICASTSIEYVICYLGSLRAGVAVAPLAPSSSADSIKKMLNNCEARYVFYDNSTFELVSQATQFSPNLIDLDEKKFHDWYSSESEFFDKIDVKPEWAFNLIYSSGTTGSPKGIVQPHSMRWAHIKRGVDAGYSQDSVTVISTPLYSNTTLVSFFPAIALGGTIVLIKKFDALNYLKLAEKYRVTHSMLVPVQYQRIMNCADFNQFDLSSFQHKFCTSAPFSAELKRDVLARWPGSLTEYYGMTEGGGTVILKADQFPDKLHTVGQPASTSDIRLIDDNGNEIKDIDQTGEVVGNSPAMMTEYHKEPDKTNQAVWFSKDGKRFIRTGDVGKFDSNGFLILMDRKKDMIISGGFNIYPSDIESILIQHSDVLEAAVIGVPSTEWGETPVAFVILKDASTNDNVLSEIKTWTNEQVGKVQRLSDIKRIDELPRSHIGKILKKDLRDLWISIERDK